MKKMKFTALFLLLASLLTGCASKQKPADPTKVRIYTLNGTTGFGMAKLMEDESQNEKTTYSFTVKSDASDVLSALLNGDADLAALPTNAAANLFNVSGGQFEVLAVNTKGCLFLLSTGDKIDQWNDLKGKTVYVPAQNPTFIFTYLCQQNGLTVGTDVVIDSTSYAVAANLKDAVASGAVEIAVLPEPMVTIAKSAAENSSGSVNVCMDLTVEWDKVAPVGSLVQGCIVANKTFSAEHKEELSSFLKAYRESVNFTAEHASDAAALIVKHGIFTNEKVAEKAIPQCNLTYLDGAGMKSAMNDYLTILFSVNPKSIGGKLPTDDFYYEAK